MWRAGNYRQLSVPMGPVPHVLRMLGAQMMKMDAGILRKILVESTLPISPMWLRASL